MQNNIIFKFSLIISLSIFLSACAIFGDPTEIDETTGLTDYEVLKKAENVQNAKDWPRVIKIYETIKAGIVTPGFILELKTKIEAQKKIEWLIIGEEEGEQWSTWIDSLEEFEEYIIPELGNSIYIIDDFNWVDEAITVHAYVPDEDGIVRVGIY